MTTSTEPRIQIRRSEERGHTKLGWLDSRHSFSFGEYYDDEHVAFRSLRVINEDRVAPGMGFGTHPHRDMEILTYVVSGELQHRDSMGNGRVIRAGELQAMSAGRGIAHSEFNPSRLETSHFLQIWIQPRERSLVPSYAEREPISASAPLALLGSPDGRDGSVQINQDASLYLGTLLSGEAVQHETNSSRGLWVQVINGSLTVEAHQLGSGDGARVENLRHLRLHAAEPATFLLFDLL